MNPDPGGRRSNAMATPDLITALHPGHLAALERVMEKARPRGNDEQ